VCHRERPVEDVEHEGRISELNLHRHHVARQVVVQLTTVLPVIRVGIGLAVVDARGGAGEVGLGQCAVVVVDLHQPVLAQLGRVDVLRLGTCRLVGEVGSPFALRDRQAAVDHHCRQEQQDERPEEHEDGE
jgi:hypothetical protein